jgi:hypothetical protein
MIEKSKKVMLSKELEQLSMFPLERKCLEELLTHLVILLTDLVLSKPPKEEELNSRPLVSSQENLCMNPCKPVLRPLIAWFLSEEVKENLSSEIGKPEKQPSLLTQLLIKSRTLKLVILRSNSTVFMSPLDRRDPQLPILLKL